jgi:hypothetical protein
MVFLLEIIAYMQEDILERILLMSAKWHGFDLLNLSFVCKFLNKFIHKRHKLSNKVLSFFYWKHNDDKIKFTEHWRKLGGIVERESSRSKTGTKLVTLADQWKAHLLYRDYETYIISRSCDGDIIDETFLKDYKKMNMIDASMHRISGIEAEYYCIPNKKQFKSPKDIIYNILHFMLEDNKLKLKEDMINKIVNPKVKKEWSKIYNLAPYSDTDEYLAKFFCVNYNKKKKKDVALPIYEFEINKWNFQKNNIPDWYMHQDLNQCQCNCDWYIQQDLDHYKIVKLFHWNPDWNRIDDDFYSCDFLDS